YETIKRSIDLRQAAGRGNEPELAAGLNYLAVACVALGRVTKALALMDRSARLEERAIAEVFCTRNSRERAARLARLRERFEQFLSLILRQPATSPDVARLGLDFVLRRRGVEAEAISGQRDAVLSGLHADLEPKLRQLNDARMKVARERLSSEDARV